MNQNVFLTPNHFPPLPVPLQTFHSYNSSLLSTQYILHPVHDQRAFKTLNTQSEYAALYFTGSRQYWQTRTGHWTVYGVETPKKKILHWVKHIPNSWPKKPERCIKRIPISGSQLVIFSSLFVLSMLNNSYAFHSKGRMKGYLPFSCIFKLPLCRSSQAAQEKAINL